MRERVREKERERKRELSDWLFIAVNCKFQAENEEQNKTSIVLLEEIFRQNLIKIKINENGRFLCVSFCSILLSARVAVLTASNLKMAPLAFAKYDCYYSLFSDIIKIK